MDNRTFIDTALVSGQIKGDVNLDIIKKSSLNVRELYKILDRFMRENGIDEEKKWNILIDLVETLEGHIANKEWTQVLEDLLESYRVRCEAKYIRRSMNLVKEIRKIKQIYRGTYKIYPRFYKIYHTVSSISTRDKVMTPYLMCDKHGITVFKLDGRKNFYGYMIKENGEDEFIYEDDGLDNFVTRVLRDEYKLLVTPSFYYGPMRTKVMDTYNYEGLNNEEYLKFVMLGIDKNLGIDSYKRLDKVCKSEYDFKALMYLYTYTKKYDISIVLDIIDKVYEIVEKEKETKKINMRLGMIGGILSRYGNITFENGISETLEEICNRDYLSLDDMLKKIGVLGIRDVAMIYIDNAYEFEEDNKTVTKYDDNMKKQGDMNCEDMGFIVDLDSANDTRDIKEILKAIQVGKVVILGEKMEKKVWEVLK